MPEVTLVPTDTLPEAVTAHLYLEDQPLDLTLLPSAIPAVQDLDREMLTAIEGNRANFDMRWWRITTDCGTTHCIAGWAVALAGVAGTDLEDVVGTEVAAQLIYAASGSWPPPGFIPTCYRLEDEDPANLREPAVINARALDALRARVAAREAQP